MDQNTTALGGEPSIGEGSTAADVCVPPGERAGDALSQLQKVRRSLVPSLFTALSSSRATAKLKLSDFSRFQVAFELYSPTLIPRDPTKAGISGAFLSVVGGAVQTSCPTNARTLFATSSDALAASQGNNSSESSPPNPSQPIDSAPPSPPDASGSFILPTDSTNNGGKVVKRRTSASALSKPTAAAKGKGKKRTNSTDGGARPPVGAGPSRSAGDVVGHGETARWWIEIPEASVWTIVGVESVRYTFFVPRGEEEEGRVGRLVKPVTPLPEVLR